MQALQATDDALTLQMMRRADGPFAAELERYRVARNLTPAQLARAIGASTSQVSRWRHGGGISIAQLQRVAEWMGRPLVDLMPLAGYHVDAASASSAQQPSDAGLAAVEAAWPSLDAGRREIIAELAVRYLANGARTTEEAERPPATSTPVATSRAARVDMTLSEVLDLLQRVPAPDDQFQADLDQVRAAWRRASADDRRERW